MNASNETRAGNDRFEKGWEKIHEIDGGILQQCYQELPAIVPAIAASGHA